MKISIAMATYNGARYIQEQLESFLSQTRQPDELIITDDCSSDQTEAIVLEFAKKAPFTVEFHRNHKNLGYCGNFNAALMKTTGDLVFLSDQDDVWFAEKIEYMTELSLGNPEALALMNNAELTDGKLKSVGLTKLNQMKSAGIGVDGFVMGCCCAVRRELLDLCLPIPEGARGHDNWLIAFADGLKAKIVDRKVLQYYRRHESNESHFIANKTTKVTRFEVLRNKIKNVYNEDNNNSLEEYISQKELVAKRAEEKLQNTRVRYRDLLKNMLVSLYLEIEHQKARQALKKRVVIVRVLIALRLLCNGDYRRSNGLKSFLRDIYG